MKSYWLSICTLVLVSLIAWSVLSGIDMSTATVELSAHKSTRL